MSDQVSTYRTVPPLPPALVALQSQATGTTVVTQYQKSVVNNLSNQVTAGQSILDISFQYTLDSFQLVHNGLTLAEGTDFDYTWLNSTTVQLNFSLEAEDVVLAIY